MLFITSMFSIHIVLLPCFLSLAASINPEGKCPQGWSYHPTFGACYGVDAGGFSGSRIDAENYCKSFGAHLPTIHSIDEFEHIQSYAYMAGDNVWTGIYTQDGGKTFISLDKTETSFINNSTNWCFGGYSGSLGTRCIAVGEAYGLKCVYDASCDRTKMHTVCKKAVDCLDQNGNPQISDDSWISNNCTTFNTCWKGKLIVRDWPYECDAQEQCVISNGKQMCQSSKCLVGWRFYGNTSSCYLAIRNVSFLDGENFCQYSGVHLTSIHSFEENNFIKRMIRIGSSDVTLEDQTILGSNVTYIPQMVGTWTDGTPVDYNNGMLWPNPYNLQTPGTSAMLSDNPTPFNDGEWYLLANNTVLRNGICKMKSLS